MADDLSPGRRRPSTPSEQPSRQRQYVVWIDRISAFALRIGLLASAQAQVLPQPKVLKNVEETLAAVGLSDLLPRMRLAAMGDHPASAPYVTVDQRNLLTACIELRARPQPGGRELSVAFFVILSGARKIVHCDIGEADGPGPNEGERIIACAFVGDDESRRPLIAAPAGARLVRRALARAGERGLQHRVRLKLGVGAEIRDRIGELATKLHQRFLLKRSSAIPAIGMRAGIARRQIFELGQTELETSLRDLTCMSSILDCYFDHWFEPDRVNARARWVSLQAYLCIGRPWARDTSRRLTRLRLPIVLRLWILSIGLSVGACLQATRDLELVRILSNTRGAPTGD